MPPCNRQPLTTGMRAFTTVDITTKAVVAVLLDWNPGKPEYVVLSLFGHPFKNGETYEVTTERCHLAIDTPNKKVAAGNDVTSVSVIDDEQIFEVVIPTLAPILSEGNVEDVERTTIVLRLPAEQVKNFFNLVQQVGAIEPQANIPRQQ